MTDKNIVATVEDEAVDEKATLDEEFAELLGENAVEEESVREDDFASCTLAELYKIAEAFPEENVAADIMSDGFRVFTEGRRGDPCELYGGYLKLKKCFQDNNAQKEHTPKDERRGYSSFGSSSAKSPSSSLTRRQMDIAKASGMSYREYAELLDGIKTSSRLTK